MLQPTNDDNDAPTRPKVFKIGIMKNLAKKLKTIPQTLPQRKEDEIQLYYYKGDA